MWSDDTVPYRKKELLALTPKDVDPDRVVAYVRRNLKKAARWLLFEPADCQLATDILLRSLKAIDRMGFLYDYAVVCRGLKGEVFWMDVMVQLTEELHFYIIPIRIGPSKIGWIDV